MSTVDQLLEDILSNPDALPTMSEEQLLETRQKLSMYGLVVPSEIKHFNISVINWRDQYLRKLHTTALVGYLYRCAAEINRAEFTSVDAPPQLLEAMGSNSNQAAVNKIWRDHTRGIVEQFLNSVFEFNPDRHLRAEFKENTEDPERVKNYNKYKEAMATGGRPAVDVAQSAATVHSAAITALNVIMTGASADPVAIIEAKQALNQVIANTAPEATVQTKLIEHHIPSDTFHAFGRYFDQHFELIREATCVLYAEKPDIDFAIQVYGTAHTDEQEALIARNTIADKVNTPVVTVSNEGWYMLGPFKRNRDRIDFYNKNTEILKRMAEHNEQDQRLGQDLMKNRVRREKNKNIMQAGPDDPGLERYKSAMGTIEKLGAKAVLTPEEKDAMAKAVREKEMAEVPEDAIQVDIHRPVEQPDGSTTLVRDKFYTKAEAPTHMLETEHKPAPSGTARIAARDGRITSVAELQKRIQPSGK